MVIIKEVTDYTNNTKQGGKKLLGTTATNPPLEKKLPNDAFSTKN